MALKPTTIRISPDAYERLVRAAEKQGCSVAQYIREAAIIRLLLEEVEAGYGVPLPDLIRQVRILARDNEGMDRRATDGSIPSAPQAAAGSPEPTSSSTSG